MEGEIAKDTWSIILNNGTELNFRPAFNQQPNIPGFTGSYVNGVPNTLLITINTTETSVTALICFITVNHAVVPSTIHVTIYGK